VCRSFDDDYDHDHDNDSRRLSRWNTASPVVPLRLLQGLPTKKLYLKQFCLAITPEGNKSRMLKPCLPFAVFHRVILFLNIWAINLAAGRS
jgi:hypothetical protein